MINFHYLLMPKNLEITCDRCDEAFDEEDRMPTILPDCGHTLCALCIQETIGMNESRRHCHMCKTKIQGHHMAEDFKANYKLLNILTLLKQKQSDNEDVVKLSHAIGCPRHPDKPVSYFCKACNCAVCVDCMYD